MEGLSMEPAKAIGILFESGEWSDYALRDNIVAMGVPADLIDMQEDIDEGKLLSYKMIVSRVFASSVFRGHEKALAQMDAVIELLKQHRIPMLNTYEAHYYEISKSLQTATLAEHGFPVPKVYGVYTPDELRRCLDAQQDQGQRAEPLRPRAHKATTYPTQERIGYPCIVKPDCGGRTTYT